MPAPWPMVAEHQGAAAEGAPPGSRSCRNSMLDTSEEEPNAREAQSTLQTVLACRRFGTAFASALQRDAQIRSAATAGIHPDRLSAAFAAVDLEAVLSLESAHRVFRESYGVDSWLVAPERGVRSLVARSLLLFRQPILQSVAEVHRALLAAADAALLALPDGKEHPAWLRQQLLSQAQSCIKGWHTEVQLQLERLLQAEQLCPTSQHFEPLRRRLQQLLSSAPAGAVGGNALPAPAVAGGKKVLEAGLPIVAAHEQEKPGGPGAATYMMGFLHKMDRRGRWQRRWFVLEAGQSTLHYSKHPKDDSPAAVDLAGATLIEGVLPLVPGGSVSGHKDSLAFHVKLSVQSVPASGASTALAAPGKRLAILTCRASSSAAKAAWIQELRAAAAGDGRAGNDAAATGPTAAAVAVPGTVQRVGSSASSRGSGGTEADEDLLVQGGVPRKISTQVFPLATCTEAGAGAVQGEDEEAAGAAQRAAQEEALLALIAQQAAERQPTPAEAAVLAAVVGAAREYVEGASARLADLTQRLVSSSMLLDREEEMRQGLLAVLLPPGASPPCLDFE